MQVLRAHGIPARYVEGYYLSAEALAHSTEGRVQLTGADTHACLGWEAEKTDAALVDHEPDVVPGEYSCVVILLERAVYGGQRLEEFELRTLLRFADKLSDVRDLGLGRTYWLVHYACMMQGPHGAKIPAWACAMAERGRQKI